MLKITVNALLIMAIVFCSLVNAQKIILLNGTTASGKSSIAKELKTLLDQKSLDVAIITMDDFITPAIESDLIANRLNSSNIVEINFDVISTDRMREIDQECREKLCRMVKEVYAQSKIVIIDDAMYCDDHIDFYKESFKGFNVSKVLVYCPILRLIKRIIHHNESSSCTEQRSLLQALDQFRHMYQKEAREPWSIDILSQDILNTTCSCADWQHAAMQHRIPYLLKDIQNALCPFSLAKIQQSMIEKFDLYRNPESTIGPAIEYDCIVSTEQNQASKNAMLIIEKLGF